MEQNVDAVGMLDLMLQPSFCVKENQITQINSAARGLMLEPGQSVTALLVTGGEEYAAFRGGCLSLTLEILEQRFSASVCRLGEMDVFILEKDMDQPELQAMALAARELREPLTTVMTTADRLLSTAPDSDPALRDRVARLNRGLFQMLRIIGNMSDAGRCGSVAGRQETVDISTVMEEVFQRAAVLLSHNDIQLQFANLDEHIFTQADSERLERAILNILSNAVKFTPKGGTVEAKLIRQGSKLYLTIRDSGSGIGQDLLGTVFNRYLRQPALEDGRHGIGLGMVLVRSTAAQHGGTVLIDQPEGSGTRITMTMEIRQAPPGTLRSQIFRVDYAGERDHGLIELAESLPAALYESK